MPNKNIKRTNLDSPNMYKRPGIYPSVKRRNPRRGYYAGRGRYLSTMSLIMWIMIAVILVVVVMSKLWQWLFA